MTFSRKNQARKTRRLMRVRARVKQNHTLPRVSVFRSIKQVYAQIIDDNAHTTLVSFSSLALGKHEGDKKSVAYKVGVELAKRAKEKGVHAVVFDRGALLYHGRIKALAEGLREGGLKL